MMRMWRMWSPIDYCSCLSVSRDKTIWTHFPRPSTQDGHPHFASALPSPSFLRYTLTLHTVQSLQPCERLFEAECSWRKANRFLQVTPHHRFKMLKWVMGSSTKGIFTSQIVSFKYFQRPGRLKVSSISQGKGITREKSEKGKHILSYTVNRLLAP